MTMKARMSGAVVRPLWTPNLRFIRLIPRPKHFLVPKCSFKIFQLVLQSLMANESPPNSAPEYTFTILPTFR